MTEVSLVFKQEAYKQETDVVTIALLTFESDELPEPIYVASDAFEMLPTAQVDGVLSNGIEFIYMPFEIWLPRDDKTGTVSAKLMIENIDRVIVETVRSIRQPVHVKIQLVLSRDVDTVEREFKNFQLSNVRYDAMVVEGSLNLEYWGLEPFPSGRFVPAGFPGMF